MLNYLKAVYHADKYERLVLLDMGLVIAAVAAIELKDKIVKIFLDEKPKA